VRREDFIAPLADEACLSSTKALEVYKKFLHSISNLAMENGGKFAVRDFGKYKIHTSHPRKMGNPIKRCLKIQIPLEDIVEVEKAN
jgi:nucleoid DNA-binding protein